MSRALELREAARARFDDLCNAMERAWVGPERAKKIISRTADTWQTFDALQQPIADFEYAMYRYFLALNGAETP